MIVLVDRDGVLADFEGGFVKAWRARFKDTLPIAVKDRREFRVMDDYPPELQADVATVYSSPGFFRDLEPIDGAVSAVKAMVAHGIDVRICTAAIDAYENCVLEKYQWVEQHLGREFTKKMVLTKDKTLVVGDWLVDDNPSVSGCCKPVRTHAVFDAPYNRHVASSPRMNWSNWRSVLERGLESDARFTAGLSAPSPRRASM
jgi:5'-nucleotidase